MVHRRAEPLLWLLFSAGGVAAALVFPVLLLLFGVAFPLGLLAPPDRAWMAALLASPVGRLMLFAVCAAALVHAAHRLRYTIYDGLQIKHLNEFIAVVCYGGAVAGSVAAAYLLAGFPD